jgi:hypothetical protein
MLGARLVEFTAMPAPLGCQSPFRPCRWRLLTVLPTRILLTNPDYSVLAWWVRESCARDHDLVRPNILLCSKFYYKENRQSASCNDPNKTEAVQHTPFVPAEVEKSVLEKSVLEKSVLEKSSYRPWLPACAGTSGVCGWQNETKATNEVWNGLLAKRNQRVRLRDQHARQRAASPHNDSVTSQRSGPRRRCAACRSA